jgi:hypothetical protein
MRGLPAILPREHHRLDRDAVALRHDDCHVRRIKSGFRVSVWALWAALERMAALFVACAAGHTALLAPYPALQTNPHHPHTDTKTALP